MSFYNPDRSYFNSASHYMSSHANNQHSSSSYYNDMYRSYTNLRQPPSIYQQPLYVSTIPFSLLKKPLLSHETKRTSSTSRLSSLRPAENPVDSKSSLASSRYSSNANSFEEESPSSAHVSTKKRDGSYESVYNSSRSSTPSNNNSADTAPYSGSSTNSRSSCASSSLKPSSDLVNFADSHDLTATAVSNIQLNCTDDLTTQVDYYLNEVIWYFR